MKAIKLIPAIALAAAFTLPSDVLAQAPQPAFPGAEGYGMFTQGGRGGKVLHVTTLEDNNEEGSFRWACNQSGKRTIVFDVAGTIYLKSELKLRNGYVTIAGQTAPGKGVCIADYPFQISCSNVIIRYMRFRLGNRQVAHHEGDGLGGMDQSKIIIDHCSVSWSIDECLSVYGSKDITVQWSMITQSLVNSGHSKGSHGYGGNWGGAGASYHHNLLAHHGSRTPRLGPRQGTQKDERMDLRNNVIYNYAGEGCYGGEGMKVNIVNNYYKPGPGSRTDSRAKRMAKPGIRTVDYCLDKDNTIKNFNKVAGTSYAKGDVKGSSDGKTNYVTIKDTKYPIDMETNKISVNGQDVVVRWNGWKPMLHVWGSYYLDGNVNSKYSDVTADNWKIGLWNQIDKGEKVDNHNATEKELHALEPLEFVNTTTHTAEKAYELVLDYAGASFQRDAYDDIMVADAREGKASFTGKGNSNGMINSQDDVVYSDGTKGWPDLSGSANAPVDSDGDGMPDEWELANGLDPNNAEDGVVVNEDGYTNLEHYLNGIVAHIVEKGNEGGALLSGTQEFTGASAVDNIYIPSDKVADDRVFNLMGIEVKGELAPGIYIRNGKKFIVR